MESFSTDYVKIQYGIFSLICVSWKLDWLQRIPSVISCSTLRSAALSNLVYLTHMVDSTFRPIIWFLCGQQPIQAIFSRSICSLFHIKGEGWQKHAADFRSSLPTVLAFRLLYRRVPQDTYLLPGCLLRQLRTQHCRHSKQRSETTPYTYLKQQK